MALLKVLNYIFLALDKIWMAKICLMLNEDKTEVIVFGQSNDSAKVLLDLSIL